MEYIVNGEIITIEEDEKPYGEGHEGKLYLRGDNLYKVYYENNLCVCKDKFTFHALLCCIDTNHVNLPDALMYKNTDSFSYAGYVTKKVGKKKKRHGATKMDGKSFFQNLTIWESDAEILAENHVLMIDVGFHNYIYDEEGKAMHIIDPGGYQTRRFFVKEDYRRNNLKQIDDLTKKVVVEDILECPKLFEKKDELVIRMEEEMGDSTMHEYLEHALDTGKYNNVNEFLIEKARYIH